MVREVRAVKIARAKGRDGCGQVDGEIIVM